MTDAEARRTVALAGHLGDEATARAGLGHDDPQVQAAALGALDRLGRLADAEVTDALNAPSAIVRSRAVELAARRPAVSLWGPLHDQDDAIVEVACFAVGEHERADPATVVRLIELSCGHRDALVREAAVAALGALGDPAGLAAILTATADKPAVRRRAVLALAPFEGPEVDAALHRALDDRDWQVRQAAEDLLGR